MLPDYRYARTIRGGVPPNSGIGGSAARRHHGEVAVEEQNHKIMAISWSIYSKRLARASVMAEMIEKLPAVLFPDDGPGPPLLLWQAGVESFLINVRTMVEFLEIRPPSRFSTDFSAKDLLPTWSPPTQANDAAAWTKLNDHWETASKSVMHLTDFSVQSEHVATRQLLDQMADDVLTVWERFAKDVEYKPLVWRRGQSKAFKPDGTQSFPGPAVGATTADAAPTRLRDRAAAWWRAAITFLRRSR
jgi:hypothetical protein